MANKTIFITIISSLVVIAGGIFAFMALSHKDSGEVAYMEVVQPQETEEVISENEEEEAAAQTEQETQPQAEPAPMQAVEEVVVEETAQPMYVSGLPREEGETTNEWAWRRTVVVLKNSTNKAIAAVANSADAQGYMTDFATFQSNYRKVVLEGGIWENKSDDDKYDLRVSTFVIAEQTYHQYGGQ